MKYQWQVNANIDEPEKAIQKFRSKFGLEVLERYANGSAKRSKISIYAGKDNLDFYFATKKNSWAGTNILEYQFENEGSGFYTFEFSNKDFLEHGDKYAIKTSSKELYDPATSFFSSDGKSVFWDFDDPSTYKLEYKNPERIYRSTKILQTDLPGFVYHFFGKDKRMGRDIAESNIYQFVTESGIIEKIKDLGFNTIQFLPVSQSIDGDKWSFRYLTPFINSISNKWGNPDDFAKMIDTFHKNGIAVILDFVISHVPENRYTICGIKQSDIGIHQWMNGRRNTWLDEATSWGTRRYDYANPIVREYISDVAVNLVKNYRVDGFRIDNVDGILRHGENGEGRDREGGTETLRLLTSKVYEYDPHSLIHLESHYFKDGRAKLLVQSMEKDKNALGASAYTSSRLTHYMHKEYMPKAAGDVSPWKIRDIISEKEWGESNSTVADFHNHDAAAGLMHGRATGSYAYDALILKNPELHYHAIGKIKVMEAIISLGMEGRTLDLLQTFLLQNGTFEHDSSIYWYLEMIESNRAVLEYKKQINKIMDDPAFWPINVEHRQYANVDEQPKSLVIHRRGKDTKNKDEGSGNQFVVYINMASHMLFDYVVPVPTMGKYEVILNSDEFRFAGGGRTDISGEKSSEKTDLFEFFNFGLRFGNIAPYQVLVFQKK